MTINPAEAVAAIEAMQRYGLTVSYSRLWGRYYAWNDHAEADQRYLGKTPIEAVKEWCHYKGHGWPVTVAEQQENVA